MTGQRIGYIRVSTFDQNPERQLEGVKVDRAFSDKASGKDVKRPQLEALISFARTGDTVVVHSMDRLARNLDDLRRIVQTLTQRGVHIEFVKEHLSFTGEDSPMANLMLSVMGAFAGTVAKLAMRQPFVLFKGLTFQKLCLPGVFRPGDHHNK
ncbi:recombinase family protein, partial [Serratia sp. IR-2025]